MAYEFRKHYSPDEARALLPRIRQWLEDLARLRSELESADQALTGLMKPGCDAGGAEVNRWVRLLADIRSLLWEFYKSDIRIKDLDRGLVDFPSIRDGKEVFLCWEKAEADIQFWHDLDAGYAGRQPL
jgi:hypothetical protein